MERCDLCDGEGRLVYFHKGTQYEIDCCCGQSRRLFAEMSVVATDEEEAKWIDGWDKILP